MSSAARLFYLSSASVSLSLFFLSFSLLAQRASTNRSTLITRSLESPLSTFLHRTRSHSEQCSIANNNPAGHVTQCRDAIASSHITTDVNVTYISQVRLRILAIVHLYRKSHKSASLVRLSTYSASSVTCHQSWPIGCDRSRSQDAHVDLRDNNKFLPLSSHLPVPAARV